MLRRDRRVHNPTHLGNRFLVRSNWSTSRIKRGGPKAARRFLGFYAEQFGGIGAEDADPVFIAQRLGREDRVYRMHFPDVEIFAAEHDLTGTDLCDEVAQRFRREYRESK